MKIRQEGKLRNSLESYKRNMKEPRRKEINKDKQEQDPHHIKGKGKGPFGVIVNKRLLGGNRYRYCQLCKKNHNRYEWKNGLRKKIHFKNKNVQWKKFNYSGIDVYDIKFNKAIWPSKKGQNLKHYLKLGKIKPYKELTNYHKKPMMQYLPRRSSFDNDHQIYETADQNQQADQQVMAINDRHEECTGEITVIIRHEPIIALVDTGAGPTVIAQRIVKQLGIPYQKNQKEYGTAEMNGSLKIMGKIPEINMQIGEVLLQIENIDVAENLERNIIIGRRVLVNHRMILDFGSMIIRMPTEKGMIVVGKMKKPTYRTRYQIHEITNQCNIGFTGNFEEIAKGPQTKIAQIFITKEEKDQSMENKYLHLDVKNGHGRISYGPNGHKYEIEYANRNNAEGIVIHCGSKKPLEEMREKLQNIVKLSEKVPIYVENSASRTNYGWNFKELLDLVEGTGCKICIDTQHFRAAQQQWEELEKIVQDPLVQLIHLNGIPQFCNKNEDRHELLSKRHDHQIPEHVIKKILRLGKDVILETPRAENIEGQIELWEKEIQYLQKIIKQEEILEVADEEIQEKRKEIQAIQQRMEYLKKKIKKHKNGEKQNFYQTKLVEEINKKMRWMEELNEKEAEDEKWSQLRNEIPLTSLERTLKFKKEIQKIKEDLKEEKEAKEENLEESEQESTIPQYLEIEIQQAKEFRKQMEKEGTIYYDKQQFKLCSKEGENDWIRNGYSDLHVCLDCNDHLTYNKNRACKCCYLENEQWKVPEEIETGEPAVKPTDFEEHRWRNYDKNYEENQEDWENSRERIVKRTPRKILPKWKGSWEIETVEEGEPTTWSSRTRRQMRRAGLVPPPPEVLIEERPISSRRRSNRPSNIVRRHGFNTPLREDEIEEETSDDNDDNNNNNDDTQRLIWGSSSENEDSGQQETSTQAQRRQRRRSLRNSENSNNPPGEEESGNEEENEETGLIPLHRGNSAVVINIEINGYRMQGIFNHNFKDTYMTQETAQRCGLIMNSNRRFRQMQYLENTYIPFPYKQETTRPVDVRISEEVTISVSAPIKIIENLPNTWTSQSTRDRRSRMYMNFGYDIMEEAEIRIDIPKQRILIPNENWTRPTELKYKKIQGFSFPDLSIQENQQLAAIEEDYQEYPKQKIEVIEEMAIDGYQD